MATPSDYLSTAAEYIGVSGTDNIFNEWYWGFPCYDPNMYPWCATFQSYIGIVRLSMPFNASASAAGVAWQGERVLDSEARAGDWVLFNWDGRQDFSWADHIGVVEWSDINGSGYFGTIEGNTNTWEGEVARCYRYNEGGYATAFFRPPYTGDEPQPAPQPEQVPGSEANDEGLGYRAHVQNLGWCAPVRDGQVAGTVGFGLRMEAFKISPPPGWTLTVKIHEQNAGWVEFEGIKAGERSGEGSSPNDPIIGTVGQSLRIEAIIVEVTERPADAEGKKLWFRVHQQNAGWKAWTEEGFESGTDGMELRLEALRVNPPEGFEYVFRLHIQNKGWVSFGGIVHGNDVVIGTTGLSDRIEAVKIDAVKKPSGDNRTLKFMVHQEGVGWKGWTNEGYASGTDGMELRLEAIRIVLK